MTNNTTQHTPGPWTMDSKNPCWIQDSRGKDILSYRHLKPAEVEANARLIAAAPMLLEALEAMVNAPRPSHLLTVGQAQAIERARAAIRAAKGDK